MNRTLVSTVLAVNVFTVAVVTLVVPTLTRAQVTVPDGEADLARFADRRAAAMRALPDGVLLLHARSDVKGFRESGFHQDVNFFYFTGIDDVTNAIAAIDGVRQESWLFVPTDVSGMSALVGTTMQPGVDAAAATGFDHVVGWNDFAEFIDQRLENKLYVPSELSGSSTNPAGMSPVGDPDVLWLHSIGLRWPEANLESAAATIRVLRMTKDDGEVAALRRAGATSVDALLAGVGAIAPDVSQRLAEGVVVAACLSAGADGVSFWPWVMSGPNAVFPTPFESFGDYRHLNRRMRAGELVRVDIGCAADYYQGDVGRTVPVSGTFSPGQREAWNLLVAAYEGGLTAIEDGATWTSVEVAARAAVRSISDDLETAPVTALGKRAVAVLLGDVVEATGQDTVASSADQIDWHYHGIGLWASEPGDSVLRAGMVIDFEPMMALNGEGYYLEDMVLVTEEGYELLTPGLPNSASEIEAVMRTR